MTFTENLGPCTGRRHGERVGPLDVARANPQTSLQAMTDTLAAHLDARTSEGVLAQSLPEGAVRCVACGHRCLIRDGRRGVCRVRFNEGGRLLVPHGYVAALQCDPVEKKPFFHVLPGADALTFGMLGCDFHCGYCQNWVTSQALRDRRRATTEAIDVTAEALVALAEQQDARLVVSSYNEPLITAEWAAEVFKPAAGARLSSPASCPTAMRRPRRSTSSDRSPTATRSTSRP